jgi:hypothetical protein
MSIREREQRQRLRERMQADAMDADRVLDARPARKRSRVNEAGRIAAFLKGKRRQADKTRARILRFLQKHPTARQVDVERALGLSYATVRRYWPHPSRYAARKVA